jgi:hypothetical protein
MIDNVTTALQVNAFFSANRDSSGKALEGE